MKHTIQNRLTTSVKGLLLSSTLLISIGGG